MAPGWPHPPTHTPLATQGRVNAGPAPPRQLPGSLLGFGSGLPTGSHARPSVPLCCNTAELRPQPGLLPDQTGLVGGWREGQRSATSLEVFAVSDEITPVQMQRNNMKFLPKASGGSFKMYLDEEQEAGEGSRGDSL